MKKRELSFYTEAELCAAFIAWLTRYPEWTPYAETAGWDILLVHADGTQVGVQAKLKFNMAVLQQTIEGGYGWQDIGPDYRAVLVPEDNGIRDICDALGLTLIRPRKHWNGSFEFEPALGERSYARWHYSNPLKRHQLPAYIPDVPAGVPSPSILSKWKIGALEISAIIEIRGYVTRADFRRAGVDHRRFVQDWLDPVSDNPGAWKWKPTAPKFSATHPVVYPQVLAEVRSRTLL
ncbi:MAG: hypothetical protein ACTS6J_12095 [Burkholderiales bacterium]